MRTGRDRSRVIRFGTRPELAVFVGGGLVTTVMVGIFATLVCHSIAHQQALDDAARATERLSGLVVGPRVPGYLAQDPAEMATLDRVIADRMSDGTLTEVTIWTAEGEVIYSDDAEDIGRRCSPSTELQAAIAGETVSNWEEDQPETDAEAAAALTDTATGDTGAPRSVEVYAPLRLPGQPPLALEAYFNYRPVHDLSDKLLRQILPVALIPLLLLQLIQIPVGLSLGRRLRRSENERVRLLQRDLMSSDQERVRFATDLHDGPIQELAGGSYALDAVAAATAQRQLPLMSLVQEVMRQSIQNLRGLMTNLDRPDLRSGRLDHTIATLAEQLKDEGIDVDLELEELPTLDHDVMATLYRVIRATLTNAHGSAAGQVTITLRSTDPIRQGEPPRVRLEVTDDGTGFDNLNWTSEAYLRMQLLHDHISDLDGELVVTSRFDQGTTVRVDLPTRSIGRPHRPHES